MPTNEEMAVDPASVNGGATQESVSTNKRVAEDGDVGGVSPVAKRAKVDAEAKSVLVWV